MEREVVYEDVLVGVTFEGESGSLQIAVGESFQDREVVELNALIKDGEKSIKVTFEDESYIWIDLPKNMLIQRYYRQIAVDGPAE